MWVEVRDNARKSTENKWFAGVGLDTERALYQGSVIRSYNNLQNRGDCQKTQKSDKASQYVGWVVGRKRSTNTAETHTHFRKPRSPVGSIPRGG